MEVGLKYDQGKPRPSLLTRGTAFAMRCVIEVLEYGARKYAPESWRNVPNAKARYEDAMERHLMAWRSGELRDAESGLHHLEHAACNIMFLLELYKEEINAKVTTEVSAKDTAEGIKE